jgi:hypothetical protein
VSDRLGGVRRRMDEGDVPDGMVVEELPELLRDHVRLLSARRRGTIPPSPARGGTAIGLRLPYPVHRTIYPAPAGGGPWGNEPVLAACFAHDIGLATLWREVVVRPVAMTDLQSIEVPDVILPEWWTRREISDFFTAVQFRAWAILYCSYATVLGLRWLRARYTGRGYGPVLLTAVVVWGGSFFLRAFGRADIGHLESALPPVCLLLAHLANSLVPERYSNTPPGRTATRIATGGVIVAILGTWIFLFETGQRLSAERRGTFPIEVLSGRISLAERWRTKLVDGRVMMLSEHTRAGDTILDLSAAPLYHVLAKRRGPGLFDIVVPGTFLDEEEEHRFVKRLEANPPAVVVVSAKPFDEMRSRATSVTAPQVAEWLRSHYRVDHAAGDYKLWVPRESPRSVP